MKYLENFRTRAENFRQRFSDARSVIVLGVNYYSKNRGAAAERSPATLKGHVARYARGKDYHEVMDQKLREFVDRMRGSRGEACLASTEEAWFESCVDTKPFMERHAAQRAGLGFIGKQTQLLSLQFGPWLFLCELLTNLELEFDRPFAGSCGSCRICIDACPTGAIEESGGLDARKCIAYLTIENKGTIPAELRPKIGRWVFGCDVCLNVCPYAALGKESGWESLKAAAGAGEELDLAELFTVKDQRAYEEKFRGTAILRAKRRQLARNTCVVLGNSKNPRSLPLLERALSDADELVREHARWAIDQIHQASESARTSC
jgi:epoxyqueuosine reductase